MSRLEEVETCCSLAQQQPMICETYLIESSQAFAMVPGLLDCGLIAIGPGGVAVRFKPPIASRHAMMHIISTVKPSSRNNEDRG